MNRGTVFHIQRYSTQDGPGIRTTVFLKGCPLHCPWCHSPESQRFVPELLQIPQRCIGEVLCGDCARACSEEAISLRPALGVDWSHCSGCFTCTELCPSKALEICGKSMLPEEVLTEVEKDGDFYLRSGGGVTLSGGECLAQPAFCFSFLKLCKAAGLHTAVDTSGFVERQVLESILPYTDLFLYDLKHMDSEIHRRVIGAGNERILENALFLAENGGKLQIRIPLIPGFNGTKEAIGAIGTFCGRLGDRLTGIQLLPYHNYGLSKYARIQNNEPVFEVAPLPDEAVASYAELLRRMGLHVTIH